MMTLPRTGEPPNKTFRAIERCITSYSMLLAQGYTGRVCVDVSTAFPRFVADSYIEDVTGIAEVCSVNCEVIRKRGTLIWCRYHIKTTGRIDAVLAFLAQFREIADEAAP